MRRIVSFLVLSFSVILATATTVSTPRTDPLSEIERCLTQRLKKGTFAGTVLVARQGEFLYEKGFGLADRENGIPNKPNTQCNICSMGKTFTAAAVMLLVEGGKVDVQAPIGRFLPDVPQAMADSITVHHLLSHTSGLGNYMAQARFDLMARDLKSIDSIYGLVKREKLAFLPGTRFHYSNSGYIVLGKIIEEVSGQDYFDFVRRHIFEPLGMDDTKFYLVDERPKDVAIGYKPQNGTNFIREPYVVPNPASDGGVHSTVGDLLKFDAAMHGGALVSEPPRDLMFRPNLNGYGYGFSIKPAEEHASGKVSIGHT